MSVFKTELHCHTKESSICGKVMAKDVVRAYIREGYSTLVLTDHYGHRHIGRFGEVNEPEHFLMGYYAAKEAAKDKINVILGMEISLSDYPANDYLIFGDVESALMKEPEMYRFNMPEFCEFAHSHNLMVFQAHPFRNKITIVDPAPLDGIEVFNSHPRHDSRNSIAQNWTELFGKKAIAGSDAHQPQDFARSGIISQTEITDSESLLSVLKSEAYELILTD